jgi:hypothetical protein
VNRAIEMRVVRQRNAISTLRNQFNRIKQEQVNGFDLATAKARANSSLGSYAESTFDKSKPS